MSAPSSNDAGTDTPTPAPEPTAPATPEPSATPEPETPAPAPAHELGELVGYPSAWPVARVQYGLVVEVDDRGWCRVAWLDQLSGFIPPADLTTG